jgi:DNA processing protein
MTPELKLWAEQDGHHVITPNDAAYPPLLKNISDPPKMLMILGDLSALSDPQIAMVGSRNMTPYGRSNAFEFAKDLAQSGITITSGLAHGIDGQAHRGAIAGGGKTIAVLGTSIDIIYPSAHETLAQEILDTGGAIVSELPLGTRATKFTFPQRNRIVTGLSLGTIVIEAALKSGSLISARLAMEQGRDVFALPGSIHSPLSKGCHQLIQQGVKLTQSSSDILLELAPHLKTFLHDDNQATLALETTPLENTSSAPHLDAEHLTLLEEIDYNLTPVDALIERTGVDASAVCSMLLRLELESLIEHIPGGYRRLR